MSDSKKIRTRHSLLERYVWALGAVWTVVVAASLIWNVFEVKREILEAARIQARFTYKKDVIYRRWNAQHNLVYVPVTEETQPNPYLSHIPDRDISTPAGKLLTLMNPAYMTRQVHEIAEKAQGIRGHITSLNPIRPENSPDPWETKALQAFESGQTEISSIEEMEGKEYMRLMRPLVTEKSCLGCHAAQGYKEGDIRGGISISIPMDSLKAIARKPMLTFGLGHVLLWLMGLGGIVLATEQLKQRESARRQAAEALEKAKDELETRVEERTSELEIANEQLREEITQRKQAEKRIEHLNLVLRSVRSVNQLIVRERDRDRLIQDACRNFIKNRGFYSAWIALVGESRRLVTAAEAGLGKAFQPLLKNLKQGNQPNCMRRVLAKPGILTIKDPASTCGDCPLANIYKERGVFSSRLEHDGKIYGILTVSFPIDYSSRKEERSLFEEVVGDIAYALRHIEMEEEHKRAEESLRKSEEKYRTLTDNVNVGVYRNILEPKGKFIEINPAIVKMFGYKSKKELLSINVADLYQDPEGRRKFNAKILQDGFVINEELQLKKKDGTPIIGSVSAVVIKDNKGKVKYYDGVIEDVTERKKTEEHIRASLKEKEVLLQEVHHRVKNNMQIISSLFSLQSAHIKDNQVLEMCKSSQNRVRSMALIHERLYQSKDMARVDFAEYAQSLTSHLFSSHGIKPEAIKLNLKIKDVFLDLNTAIPCGLIINELVSNSLKHAFPGEKKGEIKIAGHPLNKNEIELVVSDNGVGLPKEVDFKSTESLGLHLVTILAEDQLHGDIKLDRTRGTSFHIRFKVKR